MCGIVGVINTKAVKGSAKFYSSKICSAFETLLWADMLRGEDATGIMSLDKDEKLSYIKVEGNFHEIKKHKEYNSYRNFVDTSFFTVGHNRSATRGSLTVENAHPFLHEKIMLVHNGTLDFVPHEYKHKDKKLDVDSLSLTKMIYDLGIEKAVQEFSGAYACVWIDARDSSLNIARNQDRPLSLIHYDSGIVISSEAYLGAWALERNDLAPVKIEPVKTETHYKIRAEDMKMTETSYPKGKSKVYFSPPTVPISSYEDYWDDVYASHYSGATTVSKEHKNKPVDTAKATTSLKGLYNLGDLIVVRIKAFKIPKQSSFSSFEGEIEEEGVSKLKHKVVGNTSIPSEVLSDFDTLYTGVISSIIVNKTDFALISVRDLTVLDSVEENDDAVFDLTKNVKEDFEKGQHYYPCDCCSIYFAKDKLTFVQKTSTIQEGEGRIIREIRLCQEVCLDKSRKDPTLFDRVYAKKLKTENKERASA